MISKTKSPGTVFILIIIFAFACYLQTQLLINWDVSWLLLATKRWLAGGTYALDFFDSDPPMILYIYALPLLFARYLHLNILSVFPLFIFIISCPALYLAYQFIAKIFAADNGLKNGLILTLACGFWILPIYEFGQRDHIILMFITPYIFSVLAYMTSQKRMIIPMAIATGLMAGIGFGIKPFYVGVFLLCEMIIALYTRQIKCIFRLENVIIAIISCMYAISIFGIFPDYISVIVPYAWKLYPGAMGVPLKIIIFSAPVIFCLISLLYVMTMPVADSYVICKRYLMAITLAFLLIYIYPRNLFYYHFVPVFAYVFLLLIFTTYLMLQSTNTQRDFFHKLVMAVIFFIFLVQYEHAIWTTMVFQPGGFFSFFALVFAALLFCKGSLTLVENLWIVSLTVGFALALSYLLRLTSYFPYRFEVSVLSMIVIFAVITPAQETRMKFMNALNAMLVILIFSFPACYIFTNYQYYRIAGIEVRKHRVDELLKYKMAGPIAFFSTEISNAFPAFEYAQADFGSRFPFFWMLPTLVADKSATVQWQQARNFLIDAIAYDLTSRAPAYVFIDRRPVKPHIDEAFEYLAYFNENKNFQLAWLPYHYLTTYTEPSVIFAHHNLQVFDIYKRT